MGNSQGSYEISKKPIDENTGEDRSLGLESCAIPASRITASSSTDEGPAFFARLNGTKSWCAGSPADSFLEVDLDTLYFVSGVATQGNPSGNKDYVKKYKIQYSVDGMEWEFYKENYKEVLEGNTDHNSVFKRKLDPNFKARYVRFWPTAWFQWPCLRVEIYGRPAPPEKMSENGVVTIKVNAEEKQKQEEQEIEKEEREPMAKKWKEEKIEDAEGKEREKLEEKRQQEWKEWKEKEEEKQEDEWEKEIEDIANVIQNEEEEEREKETQKRKWTETTKEDDFTITREEITRNSEQKEPESDEEKDDEGKELDMELLTDITAVTVEQRSDVNENIFSTLDTSTPAKPIRLNVNKADVQENNDQVLAIKRNDADFKRLMNVKAKLELEAQSSGNNGVQMGKKKKRVTLEDEPVELVYVPRRIYDDMWGDSPTNSLSEGLDSKEAKPLIEIQDGGAPLAKHEDDGIEEATDHQTSQAVTIRTVKTIRTRVERHVGHNHEGHDDHTDSCFIRPTTSNVSHDAPDDLFLSFNCFNETKPYAANASCGHLHPTDPVVQVAMESSFNERYDSMDQINIDALASRRFSGLDLLQSPYDAVSGEDIQRLLAWEDETLPGWTRIKKSRDYEIHKGTAVDGGPPIIKVVISLKKIAYEEAVRRITDWKVRQEWDKTFDKITFIEQSYNFNVVHCSIKNQGLTLAVLDDVDIDEPYHASVWSVADHPDSYSISTGKPLRYETMISGLVIRPTLSPQDISPSTQVTLLFQIKGTVSQALKGTYLTGNPDKWVDMLKKYTPPVEKKPHVKKPHVKKVTI